MTGQVPRQFNGNQHSSLQALRASELKWQHRPRDIACDWRCNVSKVRRGVTFASTLSLCACLVRVGVISRAARNATPGAALLRCHGAFAPVWATPPGTLAVPEAETRTQPTLESFSSNISPTISSTTSSSVTSWQGRWGRGECEGREDAGIERGRRHMEAVGHGSERRQERGQDRCGSLAPCLCTPLLRHCPSASLSLTPTVP